MQARSHVFAVLALVCLAFTALSAGCGDDSAGVSTRATSAFEFANDCWAVRQGGGSLVRDAISSTYLFEPTDLAGATPFFLKPTGLGTYLLYDDERGYLTSDGSGLTRAVTLESDLTTLDDAFQSPAEWELEATGDGERFHLRHLASDLYLSAAGMMAGLDEAAALSLEARNGCAPFPEESTHVTGEVTKTQFEDGDLFGFADIHTHMLSNFAFGGGGIFHGAPFHRLGVEHALMSCEMFHGPEGRKDLFGAGFDANADIDINEFVGAVLNRQLSEFNHFTDGYPDFTTWPSAPFSSTHQTSYYKWLERAYLGGLRLTVNHLVSNQIICDFLGGVRIQPIRYSCNEMVAIDRQLDEMYDMQDYIDAQEGGPGKGWFRIVTSPAEAREVIRAGKLAVLIGIETSSLFDCFLTPREGFPTCDEGYVVEQLEHYYERGVRAIFPVHKYDNAFSAGDGHKGFIELGAVLQNGHFSNFGTDCPDLPTVFDRGRMQFAGLNMPRDDYFAPAPNDFSMFFRNLFGTLVPFLELLQEPSPPGDFCQQAGLTDLGELLIEQMMRRGMIVEIDHLPRRSYARAFEMLRENDYPAVGSHGNDNRGRLYELGGVSATGFGRCRSATQSSTVDDGFQSRLEHIRQAGGYPAIGFSLDLNGFAGAPGPRFGERSSCRDQTDPLTYPFTSFGGDVTLRQPSVGNRLIDFNTDGLTHIGLLPDLIEDVRRDGVTDEEIEPLFRSAEGYIRMWEKAERRSAELTRR